MKFQILRKTREGLAARIKDKIGSAVQSVLPEAMQQEGFYKAAAITMLLAEKWNVPTMNVPGEALNRWAEHYGFTEDEIAAKVEEFKTGLEELRSQGQL